MNTFTEAAEVLVKAATWLSDEDEPIVTGLRMAAAELDNADKFNASLYKEFNVTCKYIKSLKPKDTKQVEAEEVSEEEAFLDSL